MYRIGQEEIDAITRVINSRDLFKINGGVQEVHCFEEELKEKFETKNAILMTSGKAAIISALVAMGVGPGDEVIVPAYTYIATAIAVTAVGAIPVVADVDKTLTLDPDSFEKKISKATKVVIPVHIQGFPCNMDKICEIAKKHNILVLEDACQSVGAKYHGKRLGTIGEAGAYSFNFFKIITAGEGGAMVTNDHTLFERGLIYHDSSAIAYFGNQLENVESDQFCGTEFRVSEFTGAILRQQLKKLDPIIEDLHKNRDYVMDKLSAKYGFIDSNDRDGDLASTIPLFFDTEEEAISVQKKAQEKGIYAVRPIETGKHVYTNWTPIVNHYGAFNPLMDPFKMEANKGLNMDYSPEVCKTTLDYLARTLYVNVDPDWTCETMDNIAASLL